MKQEPDGFAEFWEKVWRPHARHTDGRGLARDTFAKLVKSGADPADIIDGARCFFRTMKDRDRDYVPLASTWLNRMAFEDFAEQERAYQARIEARKAAMQSETRSESPPQNVVQISPERRAEQVARARALVRGAREA